MHLILRHIKNVLRGTAALFGTLGAAPALATGIFSNTAAIDIPDSGTSGAAGPYPSTIQVGGMLGTVTKVTVTLHDFSHTDPHDVVVILVGPQGDQVKLMMDSGSNLDASGLTFTFDDEAASEIPGSSALASGTVRPESDGNPSNACSPLPAPFPAGTVGSALSVYNDKDPSGTWSLYVCDEIIADTGSFAGGWSIRFECATATTLENPTADSS